MQFLYTLGTRTYIYHYTNLTFVGDREINGSHSTCAKKFSFSALLDWTLQQAVH